MSDSLRPHGLQHAKLPCLSPTCGVFSNSCPSSQWCHPTVSSSVIPFFSFLQSFLALGYFPVSQFFASGGQLEIQLRHHSFQWIFRTDFLKNWLVWFLHLPFSSVQFSRSVVSDSLRPHELQHTRPPCPSPTPGVHPNSCSLSRWCHPAISSSVVPFSSCPQSLPASGSFPKSQLFASGGQSTGVSALA